MRYSDNSLPCFHLFIFRVFLALSEDARDRGTIVAQGGGKVSDCIIVCIK